MSEFSGLYDIRDARESDLSFIMATFLRGLYHGDSWFSLIERPIFMTNYKPAAEAIVAKSVIKVACLKEDQDVIIGYSILSQDFQVITWTYVKKDWRNKGIARSLVPKYPVSVSHLTEVGKKLLSKFDSKPTFNPFRV